MKISNKPNFAAGTILLLIAAFFSISLALIPLDFGNFGPAQDNLLYITAYSLGDMLFSVYGFSSILIPVFLLVAGLSCFASKWTSRKSMRLLTAVVPFFTSVFVEKLCRYFAKDYTDDFSSIKIVLAVIIGIMLVVMEIIIAGLVAERINDMIFHREKFLAEKEQKLKEKNFARKQEEIKPNKEETFETSLAESSSEFKEDIAKNDVIPVETQENSQPWTQDETEHQSETDSEPKTEKTEGSEPTVEADPAVQADDPFANIFDEEENHGANSMITQEEFAALNGLADEAEDSGNEIESEEESVESKWLDSDSEDSFEPADDLEWPDADEIKAQAGAVEIPVEVEDDELESSLNDFEKFNGEVEAEGQGSPENSYESEESFEKDQDFEPYGKPDVESGVSDESDDLCGETDDSLEEPFNDLPDESQEDEQTHETLSPDFFDIDMNAEEEPEISDEDDKRLSEEKAEDEIPEENSEQAEDDENSTISFSSDVFADMENDARKQLEDGGSGSFFDENSVNSAEDKDSSENFSGDIPDFEEERESYEEPAAPEEPTVEGRVIETAPVPERKTVVTESAPVSHVARPKKPYIVPTDLLEQYEDDQYWLIDNETKESAVKLKKTLSDFGISADVIGIKKGPVVTMFEIAPAPGVKLSKIVALQDNIALSLAASSVRIVAPIPGKAAVGIEVPNKKRSIVSFREMIEQDLPEFQKMAVPVILGKDILGKSQIIDVAKTPHLLIAGATGAGKSVCVNSIILSILYKRSPQQVKMILVDPKVVELKLYNDIPHLLTPVITEPKKALQVLQWCLCEMERRYALLDQMGVRDISSYNKRIEERKIATEKLPYIVIIIDEFADLMATSGKELETNVARLAAMSRAVGIHLVLATQRPSVNVITGLIKANIPSRIAFMVASRTDSNIIIDAVGAEKLLGKGDMLYASAVSPYPVRIQGTFESDSDVEHVVDYVKTLGEPDYIDDEIFVDDDEDDDGQQNFYGDDADPLYEQALDIVLQSGKASASYIQRRLKVGYNRAARLVEEMEARGIVGPANGSKPREIIHVPS